MLEGAEKREGKAKQFIEKFLLRIIMREHIGRRPSVHPSVTLGYPLGNIIVMVRSLENLIILFDVEGSAN